MLTSLNFPPNRGKVATQSPIDAPTRANQLMNRRKNNLLARATCRALRDSEPAQLFFISIGRLCPEIRYIDHVA